MKNSARGDSSTGSELKAVEEACREASRMVEPCVSVPVRQIPVFLLWLRLCRTASFLVTHLPKWIAQLPAKTLRIPATIFQLIVSTSRRKIRA